MKSELLNPSAALLGACLAAAVGAASLTACARREDQTLESLKSLEPAYSRGREMDGASAGVSSARIEEIQEGIARYRKQVERTVAASAQIGIYYKMLALQYMQGEMYGSAFDSLTEAIRIHPENPVLFYYSGVCAARMSMAQIEEAGRALWLDRAQKLYRRALALDPRYVDALYGLAVLLVFELDQPQEAERPLRGILEVQANNVEAMFLLGGVYYRLGRLEEALEQYREAASATTVRERREEAAANQKRIEQELYGIQ